MRQPPGGCAHEADKPAGGQMPAERGVYLEKRLDSCRVLRRLHRVHNPHHQAHVSSVPLPDRFLPLRRSQSSPSIHPGGRTMLG